MRILLKSQIYKHIPCQLSKEDIRVKTLKSPVLFRRMQHFVAGILLSYRKDFDLNMTSGGSKGGREGRSIREKLAK